MYSIIRSFAHFSSSTRSNSIFFKFHSLFHFVVNNIVLHDSAMSPFLERLPFDHVKDLLNILKFFDHLTNFFKTWLVLSHRMTQRMTIITFSLPTTVLLPIIPWLPIIPCYMLFDTISMEIAYLYHLSFLDMDICIIIFNLYIFWNKAS